MKAKQLMVGDLIYTRDITAKNYIRITAIDGTANFIRGIYLNNNEDTGWFSCDIAYEISLTEQILDINGFYNDGHDNYHFRVRPHGTIQINAVEYILNRIGLCEYVHEFQHLLRLCNLNDIADNFKLQQP